MPKRKRFLKFGGVEVELLADEDTIQAFVSGLSEEKRSSMYTVAKTLSDAGLIQVPDDPEFTTIDTDYLTWIDNEEEAHKPYLSNLCPACRAGLRFTEDVDEGTLIECAECGADLVVTYNNGTLDLRLASEVYS